MQNQLGNIATAIKWRRGVVFPNVGYFGMCYTIVN